MKCCYLDSDSFAAGWLECLVGESVLPGPSVMHRDIRGVDANELRGFDEVHLFAGIGGWRAALDLAGWPEGREVWTGSCPCQPFSQAGKRKGTEDPRHLWPEMRRLVAKCLPATIFGEQVASPDGRRWFAGVRSDLEALGYAVGCADLCAASAGAPHIRQRLWWVADRGMADFKNERWDRSASASQQAKRRRGASVEDGGLFRGMGLASRERWQERARQQSRAGELQISSATHNGDLGNASSQGSSISEHKDPRGSHWTKSRRAAVEPGMASNPWDKSVWIECRDNKARRIEPGIFPLADGIRGRVGMLRGYGNAIVPEVAAEFVSAFLECEVAR